MRPVNEASKHVYEFLSREVQLSGSFHATNLNGPMKSKLNREGNEARKDHGKVIGSIVASDVV